MRASTFFASAAAFAVASAQSSSIDPFPQTAQLAQTNSLGVVTGIPTQPAVATNQPALPPAVTSQPPVNSIPAVGTGIHTLLLPGPASNVNGTQTVVVSANNSTTVILGAPTSAGATPTGSGAAASGSGASGSAGASRSGSATGSGAATQSTGAAASNVKAAAGSLVGFGAFVAAFL
ncbi:hypothetical protein BKA66DRAFT_569617 [Pyrenochaeta sp. MPI-SDFR-AT-0127]|nr:hypothetical protein BKA66DRAFT_569617 [Pyrenochaeta sp. MPI-SDFR-AT-0127]